jgi:Flp pilus assembly protein protease CpaA
MSAVMASPSAAFWLMAAVVCAVAAVTDCRARRIPNALTLPAIAAGLVLNGLTIAPTPSAGFCEPIGLRLSAAGAVLGFGLMLCVAIASRGGGGDVKLAAALGALLGPAAVFEVLGITCLAAFTGTLAYLVFRDGPVGGAKRLRPLGSPAHNSAASEACGDSRIDPVRVPLGPFFLIGTIASALYPTVQR